MSHSKVIRKTVSRENPKSIRFPLKIGSKFSGETGCSRGFVVFRGENRTECPMSDPVYLDGIYQKVHHHCFLDEFFMLESLEFSTALLRKT